MGKRIFWNEADIQIVATLFADNYTENICKLLNRSYRSVAQQAFKMGLKKSEAFKKMELERQANRLQISGAAHRFSKGNIPVNKGKKMSAEMYQKCKATMFKKGNEPHNTKYNGHERITKDGYTEVRVKKGKYILKHRIIWEQQNGKIAKGYLVVFKDGDKQNFDIANLELITREENMKRNTIQRFPSELNSTIRLVNKLKRTINAKEQN